MSNAMPKSKCKHCVEGLVLDENCKIIGHHYCEIDSFTPGDTNCTKWGCRDYKRRTESEVEE